MSILDSIWSGIKETASSMFDWGKGDYKQLIDEREAEAARRKQEQEDLLRTSLILGQAQVKQVKGEDNTPEVQYVLGDLQKKHQITFETTLQIPDLLKGAKEKLDQLIQAKSQEASDPKNQFVVDTKTAQKNQYYPELYPLPSSVTESPSYQFETVNKSTNTPIVPQPGPLPTPPGTEAPAPTKAKTEKEEPTPQPGPAPTHKPLPAPYPKLELTAVTQLKERANKLTTAFYNKEASINQGQALDQEAQDRAAVFDRGVKALVDIIKDNATLEDIKTVQDDGDLHNLAKRLDPTKYQWGYNMMSRASTAQENKQIDKIPENIQESPILGSLHSLSTVATRAVREVFDLRSDQQDELHRRRQDPFDLGPEINRAYQTETDPLMYGVWDKAANTLSKTNRVLTQLVDDATILAVSFYADNRALGAAGKLISPITGTVGGSSGGLSNAAQIAGELASRPGNITKSAELTFQALTHAPQVISNTSKGLTEQLVVWQSFKDLMGNGSDLDANDVIFNGYIYGVAKAIPKLINLARSTKQEVIDDNVLQFLMTNEKLQQAETKQFILSDIPGWDPATSSIPEASRPTAVKYIKDRLMALSTEIKGRYDNLYSLPTSPGQTTATSERTKAALVTYWSRSDPEDVANPLARFLKDRKLISDHNLALLQSPDQSVLTTKKKAEIFDTIAAEVKSSDPQVIPDDSEIEAALDLWANGNKSHILQVAFQSEFLKNYRHIATTLDTSLQQVKDLKQAGTSAFLTQTLGPDVAKEFDDLVRTQKQTPRKALKTLQTKYVTENLDNFERDLLNPITNPTAEVFANPKNRAITDEVEKVKAFLPDHIPKNATKAEVDELLTQLVGKDSVPDVYKALNDVVGTEKNITNMAKIANIMGDNDPSTVLNDLINSNKQSQAARDHYGAALADFQAGKRKDRPKEYITAPESWGPTEMFRTYTQNLTNKYATYFNQRAMLQTLENTLQTAKTPGALQETTDAITTLKDHLLRNNAQANITDMFSTAHIADMKDRLIRAVDAVVPPRADGKPTGEGLRFKNTINKLFDDIQATISINDLDDKAHPFKETIAQGKAKAEAILAGEAKFDTPAGEFNGKAWGRGSANKDMDRKFKQALLDPLHDALSPEAAIDLHLPTLEDANLLYGTDDITTDPVKAVEFIKDLRQQSAVMRSYTDFVADLEREVSGKAKATITQSFDEATTNIGKLIDTIERRAAEEARTLKNHSTFFPRISTHLTRLSNHPFTNEFAMRFSRLVHHSFATMQNGAFMGGLKTFKTYKVRFDMTNAAQKTLGNIFRDGRRDLVLYYPTIAERKSRQAVFSIAREMANRTPVTSLAKNVDEEKEVLDAVTAYYQQLLDQSVLLDDITPNARLQIDGMKQVVYGGDTLSLPNTEDFHDAMAKALTQSNGSIADGYLVMKAKGGEVRESFGIHMLEQLWGKSSAKDFYEDITYAPVSHLHALFKKIAGVQARAFMVVKNPTMTVQDSIFTMSNINALKNTTAYSHVSLRQEDDAIMRMAKDFGSTAPVTSGISHMDDSQLQAFMKESVSKKVDRIEANLPLDVQARFYSSAMRQEFFRSYLRQTPYENALQLERAMNSENPTTRSVAKRVYDYVDGKAYTATAGFTASDVVNPLMKNQYSRWYMTTFFNLWASRLLGYTANRMMNPLIQAGKHALNGNGQEAANVIKQALTDPQIQTLLGGFMNSVRMGHMLETSLAAQGVDDTNFDEFYAGAGQSTLLLGAELFPPTRAAIAFYKARKDSKELEEMGFDADTLNRSAWGTAINSLAGSALSQLKGPASAIYSDFMIAKNFDETTTGKYTGMLNATINSVFGAALRDPDERVVGNVVTTPTSSLLANPTTDWLSKVLGAPDLNPFVSYMRNVENALYTDGDKTNFPVFMANKLWTTVTNVGRKEYTKFMDVRIRQVIESDPNVELIKNDPDLAFQKGVITAEQIAKSVGNGSFDDTEELFLAQANNLVDEPQFSYLLSGDTSTTLRERFGDAFETGDLRDLDEIMDSAQFRSFAGKIGSRSIAVRYLLDRTTDTMTANRAKALKDADQVVPSTLRDQVFEEVLRMASFISHPDNQGNTKEYNDANQPRYSMLREYIESDQLLKADLIADYASKKIGAKFGTDGNTRSTVPRKAANLLAIYNLRRDQYGLQDAEGVISSFNVLLGTDTVGKASPQAMGAALLATARMVQSAQVPLGIKAGVQQGMILAVKDKLKEILTTIPGQAWATHTLTDAANLAKWIYDNGAEPYDTELLKDIIETEDAAKKGKGGGRGKVASLKEMAKLAKNFIDFASKQDPEIDIRKMPDYNPVSQAAQKFADLHLGAFTSPRPKYPDLKLPTISERKLTSISSSGVESRGIKPIEGKVQSGKLAAPKLGAAKRTAPPSFLKRI